MLDFMIFIFKTWEILMGFNRSIGMVGLLFCAVGGIIGSGWLLGPFFAAKIAGPAAVLSWMIGGAMMMIIALTYAELTAMLPIAGGTVRFLQFSHGTLASFTIGWIAWLAATAVAPIETMALLHYATNYLPWLMYQHEGVSLLSLPGIGVAGVLLFIMCLLNLFGVQLLSKTNNLVVVLKLLVPIVTLTLLLCMDFHPSNFSAIGFAPMGIKGILAALPSAGVIFSFIGYNPAIQLAAEAKNPQRDIPIAILGALIICIILYTLLQISFIGALNPMDFAKGWSSLSFTGDAGPFAGLTTALGAVWLTKILFIDAAISPYGTGLIFTGATARLSYALGQNGYFPKRLMKLNRFKIPARMLILNYVIGMLLFLPFPTWQGMMSFLVSSLVFAYTVGPLSLCVLRKKMKDRKRPFKVPAPYLTSFLGFYVCNLLILWTTWPVVSKMIIAIILGYGVLIYYRLKSRKEVLNMHFASGWWLIPYLAGLSLVSYLSTFGGTSLIPFGWDFGVTALLSLLVYIISQKVGLSAGDDESLLEKELSEIL